jgi:hypothetical protein
VLSVILTLMRVKFWGIVLAGAIGLLGITPFSVLANEQDLLLGGFVEYNAVLQPGLQAGYASDAFLQRRPRATLSYSTTRLADLLGSRGVVEDRIKLSAGWYFRPAKRVDPYLQMGVVYTRFDREDPELFAHLDNTSIGAVLAAGTELKFLKDRLRAYAQVGLAPTQGPTTYPLFLTFGLHYDLLGGAQP